jgi:hypothetical protein
LFSTESAYGENAPSITSLIRLIASPEKFEGKEVATYGFSVANRGLIGVYLSEDDARYMTRVNAIWIDENELPDSLKPIDRFHRQWVLVEGTFRQLNPGGREILGTLGEISRIVIRKPSESWDHAGNIN